MKQLLIIIALLLTASGFAQDKNDTIGGKKINKEWKEAISKIFYKLDPQKVPHGLLLDRAIEFTNVPAYNGKLTDSTAVSIRELSSILKTLAMAAVKDSTKLPGMTDYAKNWATERLKRNEIEKSTIVLSGLLFNYARINANALAEGKIKVINEAYEEVTTNGVWQNPYEELQTIAIAPPITKYNKRSFSVVFPKSLWFTNNSVSKIEVDVNDGKGFVTLNFDQPLQVNYTKNNFKYQWIFKVTLENGSQLFSSTFFTVNEPENQSTPFANNVFIPHGNESIIFNKGAILRIDYAPNHNGELRRPFIVAEGFDPGNITSPETEGGDVTLGDFNNSLDDSDELRNLLRTNNQQYDIVYVDWQNGTNDIRHNSQVFKNVINWVNEHKVTTEKNVVLGQSMGGLIGRYTLAKMEQDGLVHDVRLFIAHDSPLQGSNTPLSIQYFSRHIYDEYIDNGIIYALGEYAIPVVFGLADMMSSVINLFGANTSVATFVTPETLLTIQDTPAAVQMNYHYVDPFSNARKAFHQVWQDEFDAMGYPQQCRSVAISNGNECAVDQGFEPRDKFINFHKNSGNYTGFLNDLAYMFGTAALGIATTDIELILVGLLPGSSKYFYDFDIHSNPKLSASDRHVYNGKIKYRKKFLWLVPITVTLMNRSKSAPNGYEPFDVYSGGFFDVTEAVEEIGSSIGASITDDIFINRSYGFIPVVSALDIRKTNGTIQEEDYFRQYSTPNNLSIGLTTEFKNFTVGYTNGEFLNYDHISFQARNGNWLAQELQVDENAPVYPSNDCSSFCSNAEIIGEDIFCSTGVYSITSQATFVNWSLNDSNGLVTYSISGNTITLNQTNSNNYGNVTLIATYGNDECGTVTISKNIEVGIHPNRFNTTSVIGEKYICDTQYYTYSLSNITHPCVSTINWSVSPNLNIVSQTFNSVTVSINSFSSQYAGIVTANIPNSNIQISKGVWVGVPNSNDLSIIKIGAYDFYVGTWTKLKASYNSLIFPENGSYDLDYEWQIPHSLVRNYDDTAFKDVNPNIDGQISIGVRAFNDCGCSDWKYQLFTVGGGSGNNELTPYEP
ncbi:MAG: hypothetical protein O9282_10040 [Flavobacterium sp.]|uniref:hypothetical protein n=1 Tax=Flavobacterium sp. TaxID=239 RepID=UPI0022CB426F|nr:hypothetical protein [Flavobacterium sp.]MCZ8331640.1 hypothetical protein [Flavobacterium sp.]